MDKVSIIIPLHNSEAFIKETIQSCLDQTYQNLEIVVVENGSIDGSLNIVSEINDSRIKVFDIGKASAAKARNYGFSKSTGDYIQYLDADDLLSPDKISNQMKILSNSDHGDLINCGWVKFSDTTNDIKINPQSIWHDYEKPIDWLIDSWKGGGMIQTGCWLTHRKLIESAGPWNEDFIQNPNDDGEFFCRVILKANKIIFDSKSIVYYRIPRKDNVSENRSFQAVDSLLKTFVSYENEILKIEQSERVKYALAYNYRRFIYEIYPKYSDLIGQANKQMESLNLKDLPLVGGHQFRRVAKLIGFKTALKGRALIRLIA